MTKKVLSRYEKDALFRAADPLRFAAKENGQKYYKGGPDCDKHGKCDRHVETNQCFQCMKETQLKAQETRKKKAKKKQPVTEFKQIAGWQV